MMEEIEDEERPSVREQMARKSGYTGLSCLHRLNSLYCFDACQDLVIDVMHKHHLKRLLEEGLIQPRDLEQHLR